MNNLVRRPDLDSAYKVMYNLQPQVFHEHIDKNNYKIHLLNGEKEYIITERLKDGLPDLVTLEHEGNITTYKCVHDAEVAANKIMKE